MTSTLCAGRALPLPVHLKIHLVAGHVCVTEKRGEADLRPEWETAQWCFCVCVSVFVRLCWLHKSLIHGTHNDKKSSCPCGCRVRVSGRVSVRGTESKPQLHDCVYYVEMQPAISPSSSAQTSLRRSKADLTESLQHSGLLTYLVDTQRKRRWPLPLPRCHYCVHKHSLVSIKWLSTNVADI